MKNYLLLLLIVPLTACRSSLKDDAEILVGEWEWKYTTHETTCPPFIFDTTYAESVSYSHSIIFLKRGRVRFYTDGEKVNTHRTGLSQIEDFTGTGKYNFDIALDNSIDNYLAGNVTLDSLEIFYGFPHEAYDVSCNIDRAYFVRK